MELSFNSLGAITKLSTITKGLSGSHSPRRDFESLKSIKGIRKSDLKEDLNKKYFGAFSKRNDLPKDLMGNDLKSIKDKQLVEKDSNSAPKECLSFKDQSVQTNISEFAKIKMMYMSGNCGNASNYMQFAEEFIEELEFECLENPKDLSSIPINGNSQSQTDLNANNNHFNGNNSFRKSPSINDRVNHQILNTNHISNLMSKYSMTQSSGDIESNTRLILDTNIIIYEADNCHDYEFGEEAFQTQHNDLQNSTNIDSKLTNHSKVSLKSEEESNQSIEWSDLVKLIKLNKLSKFQKYFK